jgi:hypothetical protein
VQGAVFLEPSSRLRVEISRKDFDDISLQYLVAHMVRMGKSIFDFMREGHTVMKP